MKWKHCSDVRPVIAIVDSNWPTSTKAALKARAFIDIEHDARCRSISGLNTLPPGAVRVRCVRCKLLGENFIIFFNPSYLLDKLVARAYVVLP